ncbi:MAG: sigma-70 family RNA polymerase sigma factor [Bacteroidales bacterium]|jgi:RNA polymerase sigma-70 factor (ECF subfamily)|nr:sigma-70 family RNA polymerase sigma factor [Bacteroidales bacterium]MBO5075654.1 sigma-70 family RNA polymerase sigma factor [Bacteroidales bacterium]MBR1960035.1 sigma-70 family RNA polymerase sigma factor [Bacteroidales bacterium]
METTGSKLTNLSDTDLVKLAIEQNQAAFIVLYTRYNAGVKSHISRYVAQKEDIEDICLESFQKAFSQIATYNPEYKFSTWLYRIARNTAFDHLSRHDREKTNMPTTSINDDIAELKELPATMHNPEEDIINQQEYDKWLTNIEKLKEEYRIVAKMNLIDNFGYKEIADALEMPINTVKTKIRRAKAQLLKMMDYSDELL